jgi:hypothetical protein
MTFVQRMVGAAKMDSAVYEEVEADKTATPQAMLVVVLQSIAAGIGSLEFGLAGLLIATLGSLVGWYVWAYLTYFIGSKVFPEPQTSADHGELLRTLGFASAPGLLRVFAFIPYTWVILFSLTALWMLFTTVVAVRQALDYKSTARAVGVCVSGWLIQFFMLLLLQWFLPGIPPAQ